MRTGRHDEGIDLATADGADQVLHLFQAAPQLVILDQQLVDRFADSRHCLPPGTRSCSPTNVRSVFDRSPMILRTGSGSLRTNVGIATI